MPSRRHSRQTGPWYRPIRSPLHPPPLRRPASVVGNRSHILDEADFQARRLQRADRGLPAGSGAFHEDLNRPDAVLHRLAGGVLGGQPGGERRALAGALEARGARACPRQHVALQVADRHNRIVKRRLNVRDARRNVLAFLALAAGRCGHPESSLAGGRRRGGLGLRLAGADGLLLALAGPGVRPRALAAHRQPLAVPLAAVAADLDEAPDVHRHVAPQVAFDFIVAVDHLAEARDFLVREGAHARVRAHPGDPEDLPGAAAADPVDVRQADFDPFLTRQVHARDTRHRMPPLPLLLLVLRVLADDHHAVAALDHLALFAHPSNRCPYFHDTAPISTSAAHPPRRPPLRGITGIGT